MTTDQLRQSILIAIKANQAPITGDLWFSLVFRTRAELIQIAQELNIAVTP